MAIETPPELIQEIHEVIGKPLGSIVSEIEVLERQVSNIKSQLSLNVEEFANYKVSPQ